MNLRARVDRLARTSPRRPGKMVLIDSRPTERNPVGSIVRTRGGVLLTAAPTDRFDSPLAGLTREQRACVVPGDRVVILCRYAPEPTHAEA